MRIFDWAVGTLAFYGIGLVLASFVADEIIVPISTPGDRLWLLWSGMIALGMTVYEGRK